MWITRVKVSKYTILQSKAKLGIIVSMEKMTLKIKKVKRKRKHGFLKRMDSHGGKKVIKRRTQKGRKRITV